MYLVIVNKLLCLQLINKPILRISNGGSHSDPYDEKVDIVEGKVVRISSV